MDPRTLPRSWSIAVRTFLGLNLLLVVLSYSTWFSGDATHPGLADHLFRPMGGNGFRLDFLYVIVSSLLAVVMFFVLMATRPLGFHEKADAWLCVAAIVATAAYLHHILLSGLLYFG